MGRIFLLLVAAVLLAGCEGQPKIVGAAPPGISYRVEGNNIDDANQRASTYCQQYGKHAELQTVNHSEAGNIAVYDCN